MRIKSILFSFFLLFFISSAYAELLTPEKLWSLKRISDFRLSPDGKTILMTISTPNIKENTTRSDLYAISIDGKDFRRLTNCGEHNYSGCFSPGSDKIAFISDRDGAPQIYVMNLDGGDPVKKTDMENGVACLEWSPDGKFFTFVSDVKLDRTIQEREPDLDKVDALIYKNLPARHWDTWIDEEYRHLFVMEVDGGEPIDLMENEKFDAPLKPFGGREQIAWSPNSTEIAYTSKKVDDFVTSTNSAIYVAPAYGGKSLDVTKDLPGFDFDPIYSPDGRYIAFLSQERAGYESDRIRLMLYNRSSSRITELSSKIDQWVSRPVWGPKSRYIYFNAGAGDGTQQIYRIDTKGDFKILTEGAYNFGDRGIQVTPDGEKLIVSRRNYNRPTELFIMDSDGGDLKQITSVNDEAFANIDEAKIEARTVKSTDGKDVHCWVVYPPNFDPTKKYPLITYCQGGPQQAVSQYWSYGWNFLTMASKGYVIVAPNRRGCPGFGQEWVDAINKDYGGAPMQDIMSATKALAAEPFIDNNRLAAIGGSAGGYAVFWLAGNHEGLYKAFVSHCGMFNMVSKYGSTEELWFPNWDNGGPYWIPRNAAFYKKNSPHEYVNNWNTPILIITGEKDFRVPYTQSLEAFTAAQEKGVPSELLYFPNENHWVLHPQEKILWYREFFRFLDQFCR